MRSSFEPDRKNARNGHKNPVHENLRHKGQVDRATVVVLGAGFGGLWATRAFAKRSINVVLIDRHNYHTFFPLLYQVGAAELEPEDIAQPLRKIFWNQRNVRFQLGEVLGIDLAAKAVHLTYHQVHYDYLVVALGSKPNYYGIPGAAQYAFSLTWDYLFGEHRVRLIAPSETSPGRWRTAEESFDQEVVDREADIPEMMRTNRMLDR